MKNNLQTYREKIEPRKLMKNTYTNEKQNDE